MLVLPDNMIGKPVGFTCSTFDLLHAGHILMLAEAKTICDYLIVGVQSDPTIDRPETKINLFNLLLKGMFNCLLLSLLTRLLFMIQKKTLKTC